MMTTQTMLAFLRRAINDFDLISDGDKIAVGLSGGKDSVALLTVLNAYKRFSPQKFELSAITIDLGFKETDQSQVEAMKDYCKSLDVPYYIVKTDIAEIIFEARKESNPCSLCSKMRRGALNTKCIELGINKLALGHHADDLIETFFLSMLYEGRLSTFAPISFMDRTNITMIRPLIYTEERDIRSYSKNLPIIFNPCPVNHHTSREKMKNYIKALQQDIPFSKDRIFKAIVSPDRYNLFDKYKK